MFFLLTWGIVLTYVILGLLIGIVSIKLGWADKISKVDEDDVAIVIFMYALFWPIMTVWTFWAGWNGLNDFRKWIVTRPTKKQSYLDEYTEVITPDEREM